MDSKNGKKISELPLVDEVSLDALIPAVQNGKNVALTAEQLQTAARDEMAVVASSLQQQMMDVQHGMDWNSEQIDMVNERAQKAKSTADAAQHTADTANAKADNAAKAAFIELWNQAAQYPNNLGRYNPDTDFFELNGLTDITYEEAKRIYEFKEQPWLVHSENGWPLCNTYFRTNLFPIFRILTQNISAWMQSCDIFRVASNWDIDYSAAVSSFCTLPNCRKVIGIVRGLWGGSYTIGTRYCTNLESVRFHGIKETKNDISECPKLDAASLLYMVNNAANTGVIEIKVHPDVMAKIQNASDYGDDVADERLVDRMVVSENMSDSLTRKQFEDMNYYIGHYGDPNAKWSGVLAKITNVESLGLQAGIGQVVMIGGYLKDDPYTFGLAYLEITDIEQRDGTYDMITGYPLDLTFDPWAAVRRMAAKRNISFTT